MPAYWVCSNLHQPNNLHKSTLSQCDEPPKARLSLIPIRDQPDFYRQVRGTRSGRGLGYGCELLPLIPVFPAPSCPTPLLIPPLLQTLFINLLAPAGIPGVWTPATCCLQWWPGCVVCLVTFCDSHKVPYTTGTSVPAAQSLTIIGLHVWYFLVTWPVDLAQGIRPYKVSPEIAKG